MDKATEINDLIGVCPVCKAPKPFILGATTVTHYIDIYCSSCGHVLSFVNHQVIKNLQFISKFVK